jgi:23S rRNA (adenine2503-C2)-methyltransferase
MVTQFLPTTLLNASDEEHFVPATTETEKPATTLLQKPVLMGHTKDALKALLKDMGEPAFRAEQLHYWLYIKGVRTWEEMTNLAKPLREKLAATYDIGCLTIAEKQQSDDGTVKYLFQLPDGKVVESVLMHFQERDTYAVCISTQVGCAVNCHFCATAKIGFKRDLSVAEIVDQYMYVQADSGKEVRNVVFMGQGEPLLNYDNLLASLRVLNESAEVGMRRITVSTAGIVPKILALAEEKISLTLAVSLHAPDDETRSSMMPINRKWPISELIPALRHYVDSTHRRLTIEYILIDGVNDQSEKAHLLGQILKGLKCNVNLIPYNPINNAEIHGVGYRRSKRDAILRFQEIVTRYGKKVTVRLERGTDIDAACGQLANQYGASSVEETPASV